MKILINIILRFFSLVLVAELIFFQQLQAQEDTNYVDLGVEFTNAPASVKINGVFGVTGRVFMDANSSNIPSSEKISVSVLLIDPNGIILDSHSQSWSGFNPTTNGNLTNSKDQMLFQIPWSQSKNWEEDANWTLTAELSTSSIDANPNNNTAKILLNLDVPDLEVSITSVSAVSPLEGGLSNDYVPNTNYVVKGTVTNLGNVMTQPGIYIPVTAKLFQSGGSTVDTETILLPREDQFNTLPPSGSWEFEIENLFLPPDASGSYEVSVTVNSDSIPNGAPQIESNYNNNSAQLAINITSEADNENDSAIPELKYVPNSYSGERGTFRGLDPVYLSFAVRNSGDRPVAPQDDISAKILLSKDLVEDEADFVLREFDLGGSGIGQGLLAGETINLTWFQQMPDNYEGDYYLIISIDNLGTLTTSYIDSTPLITLMSQGTGTTSMVNTSIGETTQPSERPDTSFDGRFVTYEKTQVVNGKELQQIYIIDMQQPVPVPKLISRAYSSSLSMSLPANGDSFRPKISADGSTVVFYSNASNLVPGDTNNKEDVYLYRLSTDTIFRAVITWGNGSETEQLNGRSLYPDVNGDGSKIVFESDADNERLGPTSGSQIFLWELDLDGGGSLGVVSKVSDGNSFSVGNGNSYNPSIDDAGNYVVFDSYSTNLQTDNDAPPDTNGLRDIFLLDLNKSSIWRANLNFNEQTDKDGQSEGGPSLNPKISGDGTRIVYESRANNLIQGGGIAKVEVIEGGYGYQGKPTVRIFEDDLNESGAPGSGAFLSLKDDGINLLQELKTDAILILDSGSGYTNPRVEISHDPAFPAPLQEAIAVAYLTNPDGDVYYIDVGDVNGDNEEPSYSKRISESLSSTGGNFGSRDLGISYDGDAIVYATKSSNLLPSERVRDDGKIFYNSNYILPTAKAILVGGIGEIEIKDMGSGYTAGTLRIDDLSGKGSGAEASYRVDNRGRIVSIDIINPGINYQLDQTIVSISEPRGGSGFVAGTIRFEPTRGEGVSRTGGGRIYKVEMSEFGYGYKIGDNEDASFADIIQFEGDGADLNEDGFPDGRLNPDRIKNLDGSLFLEQIFDIEVLSLGSDLLNTTLTISDNNNSLDPVVIKFSNTSGGDATTIKVDDGSDLSTIRNDIIEVIIDTMAPRNGVGEITSNNLDVTKGPVIDNNQTGSSKFRFSALSGAFKTSNRSAILVVEHSNMLVMGSGYTTATPVINQVPNIFGFSETKSNPSFKPTEEVGRVALLSEEDYESDDIYIYHVKDDLNERVSTSSFGMPAGYRSNGRLQPTSLSNRFPTISGNGRYVFFSSDAWGAAGLSFSSSNQMALDESAIRDIYFKDLKSNTVDDSNAELNLLYPKSGVEPFAPLSSVPIIADLTHSGSVSRVAMILNQTDRGDMTLFGGGGVQSSYDSGRYTSMIEDIESGEYSLQLVAYGVNNSVVATSSLIRFSVKSFKGSLPPTVIMEEPSGFSAVTHTSTIPLSSKGNDPDGALETIQYYVDGEKYKNPQSRIPGISEDTQSYPISFRIADTIEASDDPVQSGVRSLFVIGKDNSGNNVASDIYNISFTAGREPPNIEISGGLTSLILSEPNDFNVTIDDGRITAFDINEIELPAGIFSARVDVITKNGKEGNGATLMPEIELIPSNTGNTANIRSLIVESGGQSYSKNDIELRVIPEIRAINEGIEAEAGISYIYEFNDTAGTNVFQSTEIALRQNVDGSLRIGSGYVVAPRLITPPFSRLIVDGKEWERVPLDDSKITGSGTTSIAPFTLDELPFLLEDAYLLGGFAQSPVIIDINATESDIGEKIESVSLVIDGVTNEELTKTDLPYSFSWVPDEPRDYSITAIVRDVAGNVRSTDESTFSIVNYLGSGITVSFKGESHLSVESNGFLQLTAEATSAFGIAEVEFFIDDKNVSKILGDGKLTSFQDIIDMSEFDFRQGEHEVSVLARDFAGNLAGTFSKRLTNIDSRKNKTLTIHPPKIQNPPSIHLSSPSDGMTMPLNSSLRLIAEASDPDGGLKGVKFYANQDEVYSWNGVIEFDHNMVGQMLQNKLSEEKSLDQTIIEIDDGTGSGVVTLEFDDNGYVVQGDAPLPIPHIGNYANEANVSLKVLSGSTHFSPLPILVEIDGAENGDFSFRWSIDNGVTFVEEKQSINGSPKLSDYGMVLSFESLKEERYHLGDRWTFTASPKHEIVRITKSFEEASIYANRAKVRLFEALQRLYLSEEISIHSTINNVDEKIYLRHTYDLPTTMFASVDDNSSAILTYSTDNNMLLSTHADSTEAQPFGITWKPNQSDNYVIFAVAEDYSGNRVTSNAVSVSVGEEVGLVPEVELKSVQSPLTYSDSPITVKLHAEANDLDGVVALVDFYSNSNLVGSDNSSPFELDFDLNRTGLFELRAVARDNSGNLVTSNVEYLRINNGNEEPDMNLFVADTEVFVGGYISIPSVYKSPNGPNSYSSDIRAMVFVNGVYEDDADILPRYFPEPGEEDPGQHFVFKSLARGAGFHEIEFVVINGNLSSSAKAFVNIIESPLTNNYLFLQTLWNGLFDRDPESFELDQYLNRLNEGDLLRHEIFQELQRLDEFTKAVNILLANKTFFGNWEELGIVLEDVDPLARYYEQIESGIAPDIPIELRPDDPDFMEAGTLISMNQIVEASIEDFGDKDYFKIESLGPGADGYLEVKLLENPKNAISNINIYVQYVNDDGSKVSVWLDDGFIGTTLLHEAVNLAELTRPDPTYFIEVLGSETYTGPYVLEIKNTQVVDYARIEEYLANLNKIQSNILDFDILDHLSYNSKKSSFTNQFGDLGNFSPVSFFERLFKNKYEQNPNPAQLLRGIELLSEYEQLDENISHRIKFLHDFALENEVLTVGGYNYTTSIAGLAIPNIPIDAKAFAETALIYFALVNQAPSNGEVALLTMTPDFKVRNIAQRAKLILDMPDYANRFDVSNPEIDFIGIQNGQSLESGSFIHVEASSLGSDDLAGTIDDVDILKVELLLNGKTLGFMDKPILGEFFYTKQMDHNLSGEYKLEAIAEDITGKKSRAERMIRIAPNEDISLEIVSPSLGTTLMVGETHSIDFSGKDELSTAFLEINGKIQWSSVLSLDGTLLPQDQDTFTIDDGTGRDSVVFEFDTDGLPSDAFISDPEIIIDSNNTGRKKIFLLDGQYLSTEPREYMIEIDSQPDDKNDIPLTFRWSTDGGINFNQSGVEALTATGIHSLSSGVKIQFNPATNSRSYSLKDRWRIIAAPVNEIIEVGRLGTMSDQIEKTRKNIIRAINRARNEGKLAIYAEDPFSGGVYNGSLPEQYVPANSIILHHDASYPVVSNVTLNIDKNAPLKLEPCMDIISVSSNQNKSLSGQNLSFSLTGCLEISQPIVSLRVVGQDSAGNRYYSRENIFPIRNANSPYVKILKIGEVFDPGRLPTVQIVEVDSGGKHIDHQIFDPGAGYKRLVPESHHHSIVSRFGNGAKATSTIAEGGIISEIKVFPEGSGYEAGDLVSATPPSIFEKGQEISLEARLIGPQGQVERLAFYANGVEIQNPVTEMIGGYYRTTFTALNPGDYFLSARALYGDQRDSSGSKSSFMGYSNSNVSFLSNEIWEWKNLWSQQSISSGILYNPSWFWQNHDYWDVDYSWRARTNWAGAAPVRVIENEDDIGDIKISINPASIAVRADELLDSQLTQLIADVNRSSRNAPRLVKAFLYGNDRVVAEIDIEETSATRSTISFEWEVSFIESGSEIQFTVVGLDAENRKYYSDTKNNKIKELKLGDPVSSVGQIYQDLTGSNASPEEIEKLTSLVIPGDKMPDVIAKILASSPNMLEGLIDIMAVNHILFGEFFESFDEFLTTTEYWIPIMDQDASEEPLKRYIDSLLSSSEYSGVFRGGVPHLVGAPTTNQLVNYGQNRNLFVDRHFSLKYGRNPSTLQLKQASRRMLDYWSNNHEPGYWELIAPSSAPSQADSFTGFRRDTVLSRRPNPFDSGECAVDLIYELAKEFVYPRNQAYLSYTSSFVLRESLYKPAALLYSLHRENIDTSEKSVLQQASDLQGMSIEEVLTEITERRGRRAFNRRFNLIFDEESPEVNLLASNSNSTFWKSMPWFGTFMDKEYPWIYHVDLGWLYSSGTNTGDVWFYSDSLKIQDKEVGWFWTNKFVFEGPSAAGAEYDNQRFIFLLRDSSDGRKEGSWALLDITTGQAKPYGWLPIGK